MLLVLLYLLFWISPIHCALTIDQKSKYVHYKIKVNVSEK
jgi:hypothetical protein